MGAVYEADQEGLGRKVALQVLLPAYAENPEAVTRFQREAQAAASLGHPNIVTVTHFGSDAGLLFLVMELLAGACSTFDRTATRRGPSRA
jgi:serine/threonine-protein kinase